MDPEPASPPTPERLSSEIPPDQRRPRAAAFHGGATIALRALGALGSALREPVIVAFLLAGTFDLLSGDPVVHGMALFAVAAALGVDVVRRRRHAAGTGHPRGMPAPPPPPGEAVLEGGAAAELPTAVSPATRWRPRVLLGGAAYAVAVGGFARYSWPATLAVFAPASAGVTIAWRRSGAAARAAERPGTAPAGLLGPAAWAWAVVFVALGLWELAALLLQPALTVNSDAHPTISYLLDPILATHTGRSVILGLWLASGAWLVRS